MTVFIKTIDNLLNALILNNELIEFEIKKLFQEIQDSPNLASADPSFEKLDYIQTSLARKVFSEGQTVNNFLREFIRDFDRVDDTEYRSVIFDSIKKYGVLNHIFIKEEFSKRK